MCIKICCPSAAWKCQHVQVQATTSHSSEYVLLLGDIQSLPHMGVRWSQLCMNMVYVD